MRYTYTETATKGALALRQSSGRDGLTHAHKKSENGRRFFHSLPNFLEIPLSPAEVRRERGALTKRVAP